MWGFQLQIHCDQTISHQRSDTVISLGADIQAPIVIVQLIMMNFIVKPKFNDFSKNINEKHAKLTLNLKCRSPHCLFYYPWQDRPHLVCLPVIYMFLRLKWVHDNPDPNNLEHFAGFYHTQLEQEQVHLIAIYIL